MSFPLVQRFFHISDSEYSPLGSRNSRTNGSFAIGRGNSDVAVPCGNQIVRASGRWLIAVIRLVLKYRALSALRLTVIDATRGARFTDHDPTQRWQGRLELMPNPTCNIFARWILQSLHFVQVVVVYLVFNRLESTLDVGKVDDPTIFWIGRT